VVSKPRPDTGVSENRLDLTKLREAIVKYHVGSILNTGGGANSAQNWREMITVMQEMATKETRLGIPIIYGIDAIHGANYIKEATLFPQSIAMAATWDTALVRKSAEVTAMEIRACGIPWNFNPVLGLARQPLWPRFWETFGEDPYAVSQFARAYIKGIEGANNQEYLHAPFAAACMKHYLGYSNPASGHDRTPAYIPMRLMHEMYLVPFQAAVEAGVHTVMVNSSEVNGEPLHASKYWLTDILKKKLNFSGFVVTDWADIENLYKREKVAADRRQAVKMAVMAGIDMSMVPYDYSFFSTLTALVKDGEVPMARIDDAVRRILKVKFKLGLFEHPFSDQKLKNQIGLEESRALSLQAAREALTLLKNEGQILPLKKNRKVLVCGPTANRLQSLNGGWTYTWQGTDESYFPEEDETILEAIQNKIGKERVLFEQGATFNQLSDLKAVKSAAQKADVIVACLGEMAYCETPGNINELMLPQAQFQLVEALAESGKPVVLVLTEGRPRIINKIVNKVQAILMAYYPGPQGSAAIADVLFGDYNPGGKLPFTYPKYPNLILHYDRRTSEQTDPNKYDVQFDFGSGLSYTTFEYSNLSLDKQKIRKGESLQIAVNVKNTGARAGNETVFLFISDQVRSLTPPVRQLKRFAKIYLRPGESKRVIFSITDSDLSFVDLNLMRKTEPGAFKVMVADQSATFRLTE